MKYSLSCLILILSTFGFSRESLLRCNKKQSVCEVQNKRITVGDRVGIFTKSGMLVAIGKVVNLKGTLRVVELGKRYSKVLRSDRAQIITDKEARRPKKYFKVKSHLRSSYVSGKLGFQSMGVGNGFTAKTFSAHYHMKWKNQNYFLLSSSYLAGSGSASAKLLDISQTSLSMEVLGLSGGFLHIIRPYDDISFRGSIEVGFGLSSVTIGSEGDEAEVLNNRIVDGVSPMVLGEFSVGYKWKSFIPTLGINFLRLHNSNNFGFALGVISRI